MAVAAMILMAALAAGPKLPLDVARFVEAQSLCDHFRGEEPYDAERAAFLARVAARSCRGMERRRMRLLKRHRGDPAAVRAIRAAGGD